jgi:hypothetical protein
VHPAIVAAHAAHPERHGSLPERCVTDGCERHAGITAGDTDGIEVAQVTAEIDALLAAVEPAERAIR